MECRAIVLAHEDDFVIGKIAVRPSTRELICDGRRSVLEPRVMQVLVALCRADGAVLSKDDLIRLCWDGRIVGDDAINRVVSRLRAAAERHAGGAFRLETVTRVGYRLIANENLASKVAEVRDGPAAAALPADHGRRRFLMIASGGISIALFGGVVGVWTLREKPLGDEARALLDDANRALLTGDPDEDANAVGMLRRAVALEPENGRPWGLLALAYMRLLRSASTDRQADLRQRGEAAAARALALDPDQPDARAALIHQMARFGNWFDYKRACLAAKRGHSDHFELCLLHAGLLAEVGRFADILPLSQQAAPRAPTHPQVQIGLALNLLELGRLEEGEAQLDHCYSLWPGRSWVWSRRFDHFLYGPRAEEALRMVRDAERGPGGPSTARLALARLQAEAVLDPSPATTRAALDRIEASARESGWHAENAVIFAANRGDLDRAFRILDALYFGHGDAIGGMGAGSRGDLPTYFLFWRVCQPLWRDPRFAQLTRALGLDDYWRRSDTKDRVAALRIRASAATA